MAGAAMFVGKSALVCGAGLVTFATMEEVLMILQQSLPCAMGISLWNKEGFHREKITKMLTEKMALFDAVVFGPGLGREQDWGFLVEILSTVEIPVVWDGDGLYHLSKSSKRKKLPFFHILTPHVGEGAYLIEESIEAIQKDPIKGASKICERYGASVILKGARSISYQENRYGINPTGTPALAKGGSGDVLSGVVAALAARKPRKDITQENIFEVMTFACYLHGKAGERAEKTLGENGVLATGVMEHLLLTLKEVEMDFY